VIDSDLYGPRLLLVSDVDGDIYRDVVVTADSSIVWYRHPGKTVSDNVLKDNYTR